MNPDLDRAYRDAECRGDLFVRQFFDRRHRQDRTIPFGTTMRNAFKSDKVTGSPRASYDVQTSNVGDPDTMA